MPFSEVAAEFAREASQICQDYKTQVVQMELHQEKLSVNLQILSILRPGEQAWESDLSPHYEAIEKQNQEVDAAKTTLRERLVCCNAAMPSLLAHCHADVQQSAHSCFQLLVHSAKLQPDLTGLRSRWTKPRLCR